MRTDVVAAAGQRGVARSVNAALLFKPADVAIGNGERTAASPPSGGQKPAADGAGEARGQGRKRDSASGTVYVVDKGELKPVSVQIGITDNRNSEVLGGDLKEGDKVVVGENVAATSGKPSSVGMRLF